MREKSRCKFLRESASRLELIRRLLITFVWGHFSCINCRQPSPMPLNFARPDLVGSFSPLSMSAIYLLSEASPVFISVLLAPVALIFFLIVLVIFFVILFLFVPLQFLLIPIFSRCFRFLRRPNWLGIAGDKLADGFCRHLL